MDIITVNAVIKNITNYNLNSEEIVSISNILLWNKDILSSDFKYLDKFKDIIPGFIVKHTPIYHDRYDEPYLSIIIGNSDNDFNFKPLHLTQTVIAYNHLNPVHTELFGINSTFIAVYYTGSNEEIYGCLEIDTYFNNLITTIHNSLNASLSIDKQIKEYNIL